MSWGLEIFAADGSLQLSTDDIAYLPVDSFVIDADVNPDGSKTYGGTDPLGDLKAILLPTEYSTLRGTEPTGKYLDEGGQFNISIDQGTKTVSWEWIFPENDGAGSYTQALVFVFIGG